MVYRDAPRFGLRLITPPTDEPIELGEAMGHLNIELDDRHMDDWLNNNIKAARQYCEGYLGRCLAPQTLELSFGGRAVSTTIPTYWQPLALNPWVDSASFIELPMGPVASVESVNYYDADGALQTMDAADYDLDGGADVPTIALAAGATWPSVYARRNAIQIRYVAGYTLPDDSPSAFPLPWDLRAAMLLMLGHLYKNREATDATTGATLAEIPLGAKSMMNRYRLELGIA